MYQHEESGRSMIEMLGVLAVMAVLTIGGIIGYNYAINKHRSNVILNDVKRIALFVVSSNFMQKEDGTLEDLDVEIESDTPYIVTKESEKTFYISAGETNKKICDILIANKPVYAEDVRANAMTTKICGEGKNKVFFYINTDMNGLGDSEKPQECSVSQPCGPCAECTAGRCINKNEKCPVGQVCSNGSCTCPDGKVTGSDGKCYGCGDISKNTWVTSPSECGKCSGKLAIFSDKGKTSCYTCGEMYWLNASESECNKCWHVFFGSNLQLGACGFCWVGVEPESTKAQCEKCSNRYFEGNNDASGICRICNGTVSSDGRSCTPNKA